MIVVDTSVVLAVLTARRPPERLVERVADGGELHAPHLLDVEMLHALRRMTADGTLPLDRAEDALAEFAELAVLRHSHEPFADRVWALRHNVTAYDGMFVALAEALDAPLVTSDARLAGAPGVSAMIELFPTE